MEKNLIVLYFNLNIDIESISKFRSELSLNDDLMNNSILIMIPTMSVDTYKIEFLNPKYITRKKLVYEYKNIINKLNNEFKKLVLNGKK